MHGVDLGFSMGLRLRSALLLPPLALALAACNLGVSELPVNRLPQAGTIVIEPSSLLAPLESFRLSINAWDPDGDELFFSWESKWDNEDIGEWEDGEFQDSVVVWMSPASFADVDNVHFSVSIHDFNENDAIVRQLDLAVEVQFGDLLVRVVDLEGNPVPVRVGIDGGETSENAASEHLFTDLLWGNQSVYTLESELYQGYVPGPDSPFGGYPDTVFVRANSVNTLEVLVAPWTLLMVPGMDAGPAETSERLLISTIQDGIDHCNSLGIDTLLLRRQDYLLSPQPVPGGTAALRIDGADLPLSPSPGVGPIWRTGG
jgi:hypothetical protein